MSAEMIFGLYTGNEFEKAALEALSLHWTRDEFWPVSEFYISLKIPRTFLVYAGDSSSWKGLALGREMGGVAELFYIFVQAEARGQKLGEQLLKCFEDTAQRLHRAEKIYLEVRPSNEAAWRLYEKCSYERTGRRARYYPDGEDAWIYERVLGE